MLRLSLLLCFAVLLPIADAAPVPTHLMPKNPPSFFPTVVGTRWVFEWTGGELVEVITKVEVVEGAKLISIARVEDEQIVPAAVLKITKDGVYRISRNGSTYTEPYCLLKTPARTGDHWNFEIRFALEQPAQETGTKRIGEPEEVEFDGKKFTAVRITTKSSNAPNPFTTWYVPGIGLFKQTGGPARDMKLKSFRLGSE